MANSERPNVISRLWQRQTSGWTGNWTVHLDDGPHAVSVVLRAGLAGSRLSASADGQTIDSALIFTYVGELRRFNWHGHSFALRVKGFGMTGDLALLMDGTEIPPDATASSTSVASVQTVSTPAPVPQAPPLFAREIDVSETDEIVGVEEYPLDNGAGDLALTTDRQISKASTNECSVDTTSQVTAGISGEVLAVIKADISGQISRQTGSKIGETVTESQTLHLSVGAHSSVLYRVVWKRKVRTGQRVYLVNGAELTVPYHVTYGLSCEVHSQDLKPQG